MRNGGIRGLEGGTVNERLEREEETRREEGRMRTDCQLARRRRREPLCGVDEGCRGESCALGVGTAARKARSSRSSSPGGR